MRALLELPPDKLILVGEFTGTLELNGHGVTSLGGQQVFAATLDRSGLASSVRPVTQGPSNDNRVFGATLVGNQLVVAVTCEPGTSPCSDAGMMLISMPTE